MKQNHTNEDKKQPSSQIRALLLSSFIFIFLFLIVLGNRVDAISAGINNPRIPRVIPYSSTTTTITFNNNTGNVNSSQCWQGICSAPFSTFLNLSGTNANQNLNITPYNLTVQAFTDMWSGAGSSSSVNVFNTRNVIPRSNGAYDLGSSATGFRNIYLTGNITTSTVILRPYTGNVPCTVSLNNSLMANATGTYGCNITGGVIKIF